MNIVKDPFLELPDHILSSITSYLPIKDAMKTSILSRRWRYVWRYRPHLFFDERIMLGSKEHRSSEFYDRLNMFEMEYYSRRDFVDKVNQFMHHYCFGSKIYSLTVLFELEYDNEDDINSWIQLATARGVEKIDLNFYSPPFFKCPPKSSNCYYEFHDWLLATNGQPSTLKHLELASCIFKPLLHLDAFSSLINLHLKSVCINDEHMENLLSNCSLIEVLRLNKCRDLISFKLSGQLLHLKDLKVKYYAKLQKIEFFTTSLVRFIYVGALINFSFENVPQLAEVWMSFISGEKKYLATYALTELPTYLPRLETLNLKGPFVPKTLKPEHVVAFNNLKNLTLTFIYIGVHYTYSPFFHINDDDDLYLMSFLLKAFPLLQNLHLNVHQYTDDEHR